MTIQRGIAIIITFILLFTACRPPAVPNQNSLMTIIDILGREVQINPNVNKVAGLRAGALRMLIYMDAADMIAGIEEPDKKVDKPYLKAYPELAALPSLGPSMGGEAELIINSSPDVIFISYTTKEDADALQKKTGIPVIAIECSEFGTEREILYESFRLIGRVINKETRADTLIASIEKSIIELNDRTFLIQDNNKPVVYIGGVPYSGSHGINSTQPYYPPFMFVNADNIAASVDEKLVSHVKGTYIDIEQLLIWDPDILFVDESGLDLVRKDLSKGTALNNSLKAIANNNIHTLLPYNNYAVNYELVLINAWYAGKIIYPEEFADININDKANEILNLFFGKEIFEELMDGSYAFRQLAKEEL